MEYENGEGRQPQDVHVMPVARQTNFMNYA